MDDTNKRKKSINRDSLLETLRGLGSSTGSAFKRDLLQGIPEEAANSLLRTKRFQGELKPNESVKVEPRESEIRRSFESRLRQQALIQRQEFEVFSARKREEQEKIKALQAEVIELAKSIEKFDQEVKVAAIQQTVNPGVYHETFLEKLASFVKALRQKMNDASSWLAATNKRARKQPYYWQQFHKSGTKFMLSQERYMATQAG
jgi:predicted RNase H-like nuclease (RuvC/YqgF family)